MRKIIYLSLFILSQSTGLLAQSVQTEFGKNRVQYHQDFENWLMYESQNFVTYWYGEGQNVGQAVVQIAEYEHDEIQQLLEYRMNNKIEIIVYTDLTDLKQSNIGVEETFVNTGGQTKIVGGKMFVYFNGDHRHLRKQVREGITSVYMNAMLFGANLQEIVQNAVTTNLPPWFRDGLISYVGEEWSVELDNKVRDLVLSGEYESFDEIADDHPTLAGHAMWYYIGQTYGKTMLANLLYLTRINRDIDSGFLYVLGTSYPQMSRAWFTNFKARYEADASSRAEVSGEAIAIKNKRKLPFYNLKLSPDGKKIVYVSNEIGRYKVWLHDLETGKREVLLKGGYRNAFQATDYNYPLLAWNPNNQEVGIIYERRDLISLIKVNIITDEREEEPMGTQYQRIYSMDYMNSFNLVLSGAVRGYSDLFIYFTKTRQTQRLTNDHWDDLDVRVVKIRDKKGLLFASNRMDSLFVSEKLDTILPTTTFDIFYMDLESKSNELVRVTNTPLANERYPAAIDTTWFSFLSDESGIYNRVSGYLEDYIHHYDKIITFEDGTELIMHPDSALTTKLDSVTLTEIDTIVIEPIIKQYAVNHTNTNYSNNITEQHTAPRAERMAEVVYENGAPQFYVHTLDPTLRNEVLETHYRVQQKKQLEDAEKEDEMSSNTGFGNLLEPVEEAPIDLTDVPQEKQDTNKIDIDNYYFQSDFNDDYTPPQIEVEDDKVVTIDRSNTGNNGVGLKVKEKEVLKFRTSRIVPYRLKFRTDFVTTQMDNAPLFEGLNSFSGTPQGFGYLPPGILLKMNFKDLFEDYVIEGGIRVPTTFNGAEYFLIFDDRKKRLDKRYAIYRRSLRLEAEGVAQTANRVPPRDENNLLLFQYQVRYPLDIFRSIRGTATMRFDSKTPLATDFARLDDPIIREQRLGLKGEYVFDNTLDVAMNIKNGSRWKVYAEVYKRFNVNLIDDVSVGFGNGFMGVIGADFRHYQRFLKHSVLASRFAASSSFGSEQILFYLGGVDGWLLPQFNDEIPTASTTNTYAFQTMANNLRGFRANIRNGNSYAVANAELRMPIFKYLKKNIRNQFFRNFQVVGFFDMGTAWQGLNPFDEDNPLNTAFVEEPGNVTSIKVNYFRDPIVFGYGVGVRMSLFGYFLRVDRGWGIETRVTQDPRWYIALGMDF